MQNKHLLEAPIPGMSLTKEPGSRPWENPPQLTELYEVVDYYTERLTNPELVESLLDAFSKDAPIYETTKGLINMSVMQGVHSIDTGMLVVPVVVEMLITLAELNGVGYIIEQADKDRMTSVDPKTAKKAIEEVKQAEMQRQEEPVETPPKKGLMARGAME